MSEAIHTPSLHSPVAQAVMRFCQQQQRGQRFAQPAATQPWGAVRRAGSALWLDSGDVQRNRGVWTAAFSGLTTNNTLLNQQVQTGTLDDVVPAAAAMLRRADRELPATTTQLELAFVVNAVHGLELVRTFDCDVSVELHTDLIADADASYEYGKRFHAICPEHFVIKIALSPAGLLAAHRLARDGIRVNCTLGFSTRQNYLIARVTRARFVNVFLGRVNALFAAAGFAPSDRKQAASIEPGVAATIASQQTLRRVVEPGPERPATLQIAASMRSGGQVQSLAGVDVLTMPVDVAAQFAKAGDEAAVADRTRGAVDAEQLRAWSSTDDHTDVFFRVGNSVESATEQLLVREPSTLDAERVRAVLVDNHAGDLFPELDAEDRQRLAAGGKIPDRATWQPRVDDGSASWDGLLNAAGIASFAADQAELDRRLRQALQ